MTFSQALKRLTCSYSIKRLRSLKRFVNMKRVRIGVTVLEQKNSASFHYSQFEFGVFETWCRYLDVFGIQLYVWSGVLEPS